MNFPELMIVGVAAFFIFILLFAKFAQIYDNRQDAKKKSRSIPKMR